MFVKARKRASIGYLNLCLAFQNILIERKKRKLDSLNIEIEKIEKHMRFNAVCGQEYEIFQIDGIPVSESFPITALIGSTIKDIIIIPNKIINLITK